MLSAALHGILLVHTRQIIPVDAAFSEALSVSEQHCAGGVAGLHAAAALIAGELQVFQPCLLWASGFLSETLLQDGQLGEGQESCVQGGNVASQAALGAFELSESRLTSLQCKMKPRPHWIRLLSAWP